MDNFEEFNKLKVAQLNEGGLRLVNPKKHLMKRPRSLLHVVDGNKCNGEKFRKLLRGALADEKYISLLNVDRSDPENATDLMGNHVHFLLKGLIGLKPA